MRKQMLGILCRMLLLALCVGGLCCGVSAYTSNASEDSAEQGTVWQESGREAAGSGAELGEGSTGEIESGESDIGEESTGEEEGKEGSEAPDVGEESSTQTEPEGEPEEALDEQPPQMEDEIALSAPARNAAGRAYYSSAVEGRISITEENLDKESVKIEAVPGDRIAREYTEKSENLAASGSLLLAGWHYEKQEDKTVLRFSFLGEGRWYFRCSCADLAGNPGVTGKGHAAAESKAFVMDTTAPVIEEISCKTESVQVVEGRSYYEKMPVLCLRVREENFDDAAFTIKDSLSAADGTPLSWESPVLSWKTHEKDGYRINETELVVNLQAKHSFVFEAKDLAGNTSSTQKCELVYDATKPKFSVTGQDDVENASKETAEESEPVVDSQAPQITVRYDVNHESAYYREARTATVTVRDQNFNPKTVAWDIRGSNQKYEIGSWTTSGETATCQVRFAEDGENYAINLKAKDFAGNTAEWRDRDYFTIDRTAPKLAITMDEWGKKNGKYYNEEKTVQLCVTEKNFDAKRVNFAILRTDGKNAEKLTAPEEYTASGDKHYAKLRLKEEGTYQISASCTDAAGNVAEKQELAAFIIDTTPPEVKISGVAEGHTNTDSAAPLVTCTDKHLDGGSVQIAIHKKDGERVSEKAWPYTKSTDAKKIEVKWEDLPKTALSDGIYKIVIAGEDLAGNAVTMRTLTFSVNRFGSEFVLEQAVRKCIKKTYVSEVPDVKITTYSVNSTREKVILRRDNTERTELSLAEGDYEVTESKVREKADRHYGWHVKNYRIKKENFQKEGEYAVVIQSDAVEGDAVIRVADSEARGVPVHFVVDRTPPAVSIGNLDQEFYEEREHAFTIAVLDNYAFKKMELRIRSLGKGESVRTIEPDDLDENHMISAKLTEHGAEQTVSYTVWDAAGNRLDSADSGDTRKCFVSTSRAVKSYHKAKKKYAKNYLLFTSAAVTTGAAVGVIVYAVLRRLRSRESKN